MISMIPLFRSKLCLFTLFIALFGLLNTQIFAAGEIDTSFNSSAYGVSNGTVNVILLQPDGKILIGGNFLDVQGHAASGIARLNADGSYDTSFTPPDFFNQTSIGGNIFAIALQPDGKILVGGDFYGTDGVFLPGRIRRLNPNGTIDATFALTPFAVQNDIVYDIEVQTDGKILVGGSFSGQQSSKIIRLNADGTLDAAFQPGLTSVVRDIQLQPDGKILLAANVNSQTGSLLRLTPDGGSDPTFAPLGANGTVDKVHLLPDLKILFVGTFSTVNGFTRGRIARANADGTLDLTFNQNNAGSGNPIFDLDVRPDGRIVIVGNFSSFNGVQRTRIAQLNPDGSVDLSFNAGTLFNTAGALRVKIQQDGKIVVAALPFVNSQLNPLVRLNADGSHDTNFIVRVRVGGKVHRVLTQPDGKIIIAGTFAFVNGVTRASIARLNADGSLDESFVPFFNNSNPPAITALALQPDGKILMVGSIGLGFVRLNANGSQDNTFNYTESGGVNDLIVLPNGQILAVGVGITGGGGGNIVVKLNSNGTRDGSFPSITADGPANKVVLQPDGKILIGGGFTQVLGFLRGRIARLNVNGSLDGTFNPPGGANAEVNDMELQPDGKILLVGAFNALNGNPNVQTVGRLNADGSLDASFVQRTNSILFAVKLQPDGKVLIGGSMSTVGDQIRVGIARLNANGSVDLTFDASTNKTVWDITLQADGKILFGGEFTKVKGVSRVRIARLLNSATPQAKLFDYDGDGKADISVFRPSENKWYILKSSDGQVIQTIFAVGGDVPTPADFDGDGKTDIAIYRPSAGDWWSLSSQNGQQVFADWGQPGVIARPSDFDGDGKSDYIYFLPSNSTWYRFGSQIGASFVQFGIAGDKPVTGDFDGDGKSDVAIFRPSTGDWWWKSSVDNSQRAIHWGISTDVPAPADYDGDGKTDFAVYRPSNGTWYVYNSSNNSSTILNFGLSEDKPVPADYDGDGKADIAVFRPSTGVWYLMRSTAGFAAVQFGVSTDIPTPNAFVP